MVIDGRLERDVGGSAGVCAVLWAAAAVAGGQAERRTEPWRRVGQRQASRMSAALHE